MTTNVPVGGGGLGGLDWTGLLAWSAKYHDGTSDDKSKFKAMSKEDRDYLTNAMASAFSHIEDMNKVLQEGIKRLNDATNDNERVVALEVIDRCVDDPDCCRNIDKFGGIAALLPVSDSKNPEVSAPAADILSLMLSNNEVLQRRALAAKGDKSKDGKDLDGHDALVSAGLLRAPLGARRLRLLASIVRGVAENEEQFFQKNEGSGVALLLRALTEATDGDDETADVRKLHEKAANCLRALFVSDFGGGQEGPRRVRTASVPGGQSGDGVPLGRAALAASAAVLLRLNSDAAYAGGCSIQFGETFAEMLLATVSALSAGGADGEEGANAKKMLAEAAGGASPGQGTLAQQLQLRLKAIKAEEDRAEEYKGLKMCYETLLRSCS